MHPIELVQMQQLVLALASIGVYTLLYTLGGRSKKWLRRYLAPVLFVTGCLVLAAWSGILHWLMFMAYVSYSVALTLGYGAVDPWKKATRRAIYGLALGFASGCFLIPLGLWGVWGFQIALAVAVSVFYGLRNPMSAVGEEGVISAGSILLVPFALIQ